MILRFISFLALNILLLTSAYATDYYVSTTGDDLNVCSIGSPCLTIQRAVDLAIVPGDRVMVNDGIYKTGFRIGVYNVSAGSNGSTEATQNITNITSANPCVVTVAAHGYSNGDLIGIYALDNYNTTGMVNLNNRWFTVANVATNTFELSGENCTSYDPYLSGGTVQRITPITVRAVNSGSVTIDTSNEIGGWSNSGQPANTYKSAVAGKGNNNRLWKVGQTILLTYVASAGLVNSEGKYTYDVATDTFLIYTTSNPTLSVYKQLVSSGVSILGASWILVEGFKFEYNRTPVSIGYSSGFPDPPGVAAFGPTHHIMIRNNTSSYSYQWGMNQNTSSLNKTSYVTFDDNVVEYVDEESGGQNGHCFKYTANHNNDDGTYGTIANSTIRGCRYHGVQSSNAWSNNFIYGNRVYDYSKGGSGQGAGIRCGYSGDVAKPMACRIFDNNVGGGTNGTGTGIGTGIFIQDTNVNTNIWRNKLFGNIFHGIYIFYAGIGPTAPSNLKIFNNLIYDNLSNGILIDGSDSVYIYNNSFSNNGEVPLYGGGASLSLNSVLVNRIYSYNNIFATITASSVRATTSYSLNSDNNLFYRANGFKVIWNNTIYSTKSSYVEDTLLVSGFTQDANSVEGDPLYANTATADFRIPSPTTPADSIGTNLITTVPTDYIVETRQVPFDAGAYNTQGNLLVNPSVTLSSNFPARTVTATFSFATSSLSIAANDKIVLTFPSGFILNNGGTTSASSVVGMDGTFTTGVVGQVVTVARNNNGTASTPGTFYITLNYIQNPSTSGLTGTFGIQVNNVSDVLVGIANNAPGATISDVAPGTVSGSTLGGLTI